MSSQAGLLGAQLLLLALSLQSVEAPEAPSGFNPSAEQSRPAGRVEDDWHWWWHFNKDRYLRLREKIFTREALTGSRDFFLGRGEQIPERDPTKLSPYELRVLIVPSILAALEGEGDDEPGAALVEACLLALAKIGPEGELDDRDPFDAVFIDHLDHDYKSVREKAVIALGILGRTDSVPLLVDLLRDTHRGQRFVGMTEVAREMRAYAAYSLGMIGNRTADEGMRRTIVAALTEVLAGPGFATRDIKVACVHAVGLVPLAVDEFQPIPKRVGTRPLPLPDPRASRRDQIRWLLRFMADFRRYHELERAHVPTALARLLLDEDPRVKDEVVEPLVDALHYHSDVPQAIQRSAVHALGEIGDADEDPLDRAIRKALMGFVDHGDEHGRRVALISLGRIAARAGTGEAPYGGAPDVIKFLSKQLDRGESRMKAWTGLALGVMGRELNDVRLPVPEDVRDELRDALEGCRTPIDMGAWALSVGLQRDLGGIALLTEKLGQTAVEGARGLVALSLGLVGHRDAERPLIELLQDSEFKPEQMELTSIGLALLGSTERVPVLTDLFRAAGSLSSRGPLISALGVSGDRAAIQTLVEVLADSDEYPEALAVAAVTGLGNLADKDKLLWRSLFTAGANYTSAPPTMFGGGVFDMF